jgi:hypothetical protein
MAGYDIVEEWLSYGKACRRQSWGVEKAIIAITVGKTNVGFAVWVLSCQDIHDEHGNMFRFTPTHDDRVADDWQCSDFSLSFGARPTEVLQ